MRQEIGYISEKVDPSNLVMVPIQIKILTPRDRAIKSPGPQGTWGTWGDSFTFRGLFFVGSFFWGTSGDSGGLFLPGDHGTWGELLYSWRTLLGWTLFWRGPPGIGGHWGTLSLGGPQGTTGDSFIAGGLSGPQGTSRDSGESRGLIYSWGLRGPQGNQGTLGDSGDLKRPQGTSGDSGDLRALRGPQVTQGTSWDSGDLMGLS